MPRENYAVALALQRNATQTNFVKLIHSFEKKRTACKINEFVRLTIQTKTKAETTPAARERGQVNLPCSKLRAC